MHFNGIPGRRNKVDRIAGVGDGNRQRCSRRITITVCNLIREYILHAARSVHTAGVLVCPGCADGQGAVLPLDHIADISECAAITRPDTGNTGVVCAQCIGTSGTRRGAFTGQDVTVDRSIGCRRNAIGIIASRWCIVSDYDGEVGNGDIAIRIGNLHDERIRGGIADSIVTQSVGVGDLAID